MDQCSSSVKLPFNSRLFNPTQFGSGNFLVSIDHGISAVNIDKKFKKVFTLMVSLMRLKKKSTLLFF